MAGRAGTGTTGYKVTCHPANHLSQHTTNDAQQSTFCITTSIWRWCQEKDAKLGWWWCGPGGRSELGTMKANGGREGPWHPVTAEFAYLADPSHPNGSSPNAFPWFCNT